MGISKKKAKIWLVKEFKMNKRKSVIFLVLLFLVVSVSLFAGRGNQMGARTVNNEEYQGRGSQQSYKNVDDTDYQRRASNRDVQEELFSQRRAQRMNQDQTLVNPQECLYLETGERQEMNQTLRGQRSNRQQLNQQEDGEKRNTRQQLNNEDGERRSIQKQLQQREEATRDNRKQYNADQIRDGRNQSRSTTQRRR